MLYANLEQPGLWDYQAVLKNFVVYSSKMKKSVQFFDGKSLEDGQSVQRWQDPVQPPETTGATGTPLWWRTVYYLKSFRAVAVWRFVFS